MRFLRCLTLLLVAMAAFIASLPAQDQPPPIERIDFRTLGIQSLPPPLVFITQGNKEVPINVSPGQRSDFYTYHGTRPINFYAPGASALPPEQRQPLVTAVIPPTVTHPLLVFLQPDRAGDPWHVAVCEDASDNFATGMLRIFNTLDVTVRVDVSGTQFDLPPLDMNTLTPTFVQGNMFQVSLQRDNGSGWQEIYRSVWDMPPGLRIFGIIVPQNGKPVFMSVEESATYAQSVENRIAADKAKEQKQQPSGSGATSP